MPFVAIRRAPRHKFPCFSHGSLPLFGWAERRSNFTVGDAYLFRHKRVKPPLAYLVADLAGIRPRSEA